MATSPSNCSPINLGLFEKAMTETRLETKEISLQYWNQKAPSYKKRLDTSGNDEVHAKIIQAVTQRASLNENSRVLDLGCGPGRHSRLMAQTGAKVTGFDLSATMIELARADNPGPNPVDFRNLDWDEADIQALGWTGQFDLAFASRTPAIHNLATLQKMIQTVHQGFGVLVSSIDLTNSLRDPLMEKLAISPERARAVRSVYLEINLLWLLGYYPEVSYFDQKWDAARTVEEAIFNQIRYFQLIKELSQAEKDLISQFIAEQSQEGICREKVEAKTTLVIWEIPSRVTVDKVIRD